MRSFELYLCDLVYPADPIPVPYSTLNGCPSTQIVSLPVMHTSLEACHHNLFEYNIQGSISGAIIQPLVKELDEISLELQLEEVEWATAGSYTLTLNAEMAGYSGVKGFISMTIEVVCPSDPVPCSYVSSQTEYTQIGAYHTMHWGSLMYSEACVSLGYTTEVQTITCESFDYPDCSVQWQSSSGFVTPSADPNCACGSVEI